jgi:hypothetical protein
VRLVSPNLLATLLALTACAGSDEGPADSSLDAAPDAVADASPDDAPARGGSADDPIGGDTVPADADPAPGAGAAEHAGDAACGPGWMLHWGERRVVQAVLRDVEGERTRYTFYDAPIACADADGVAADVAWLGYVELGAGADPRVEVRLREGTGGSFAFAGLTVDDAAAPPICFATEHAIPDEVFVEAADTFQFGVIRLGGGFVVTGDCG